MGNSTLSPAVEHNDVVSRSLRAAITSLFDAMQQCDAIIERGVARLRELQPLAENLSHPVFMSPSATEAKSSEFRKTRNKLYNEYFEGPFDAIDRAGDALMKCTEFLYPEAALRIRPDSLNWGMCGLDLLRPPHIDETELFVPDRAALSQWRLGGDKLRLSIQALAAIDSQSPAPKDKWVKVGELSEQFGVNRDALRKRLERLRKKCPEIYIELNMPNRRDDRYLYQYSVGARLAKKIKLKRPARRPV